MLQSWPRIDWFETSAKVPLTGHSEGAEQPKHRMNTRKYEILRFAQDDKMVIRRILIWVCYDYSHRR